MDPSACQAGSLAEQAAGERMRRTFPVAAVGKNTRRVSGTRRVKVPAPLENRPTSRREVAW